MKPFKKKPRRSLRTILVLWFLLFSIIPLGFVTGYSVLKYEEAIDNELSLRLSGNAREVSIILSDFRAGLQQQREKYLRDAHFVYSLSLNDLSALQSQMADWISQEFSTGLTLFNREGRMVSSVFKDEKGQIRTQAVAPEAVFLTEKSLSMMKDKKEIGLIEVGDDKKLTLISISRVFNSNNRSIGFLQQNLDLDSYFLNRLRARLKLEVMLLKENGQYIVGTSPDFAKIKKDFFKSYLQNPKNSLFEIQLKGNPYGFLLYPLEWGEAQFFIALGASKSDAKAVLKNVNFAFFTVVGTVIFLLVLTILVTSRWFLRPVDDLVEALQSFETQEQVVTIPVNNDTEIGLLTESFNQMSLKIWQARADLRKKIRELEDANRELKDTQTKLVHSAKMVSLGQLVAGVAHELNNPISFIYSNMAHLKEYSESLVQLIETAENNPEKISATKAEIDFDYIKQDLPKLITSCEEGARRTRDIVLGLRNFSRLEEAKLKEVDIHESLNTTLDLLQGEIKNRIQVHKSYEPLPRIFCYASQINQVFMNILSNALQAISGTGTIWISTQALRDSKSGEDRILVSIQDNGKGMPPEILDKIFDPFFTTKGVGQGTGLGLSITYGIVHTHGGDIQVRSELNVGTEFVVTLPVHPPTQSANPVST